MIFRLSQKLAKKLKVSWLKPAPADANPFADWSAHLFSADRTQYLILTNTPSLYSVVIYGRGTSDDNKFLDRALGAIREFMVDDGQEFIFRKFVAPSSATVRFATALNRSVTGSMNDLVYHAKLWLVENELSPFDTSFVLNQIPFSSLKYGSPREEFKALDLEKSASDGSEP